MVLLLTAVTFTCFLFALSFENYEGGADNYIHYRVSRYCIKYPELFIDHWGKPVFTLFTFPFAQFGFGGLIFFNVFAGVMAAFFAWKTASVLKLKLSPLAMVFTLCMPVYFIMMASAMTEVFFSLVLIAAVYFFLREKYMLAAVLFSSLFLIRNEGYIFYPFIIFLFLMKKQRKCIPLLFSVPLFYSVIGAFYFHDFFWLINQIPYGNASDIYGTGELLFFVKKYPDIFGKGMFILIVSGGMIGLFYFIHSILQTRKIKTDFILIEGFFLVYFDAHSYVWWSGTGASAGLIRVMAAIIPLASVIALRPISLVTEKIKLRSSLAFLFSVLLSVYLITVPFKTYPIPFKYGEKENTIRASVEWMKDSRYADAKVYFYEPLIYFLLDRDPFDHSVIKEIVDDREHPENVTMPGELIFYDLHFGPNEGRLPLKNLMENPFFRLVNYFEPLEPFTVLGGYTYGIYIFERVENNSSDNQSILEKIKTEKTKSEPWQTVINSQTPILNEEFTPMLEIKSSEIEGLDKKQILKAKLEYSYDKIFTAKADKYLVISVEKDGESIIYKAVPLLPDYTEGILKLEAGIILQPKLKGDETIKIYIWSKTKESGFIHKLDIETIYKTY